MSEENKIVTFAFNAGYWLRKYMPRLYDSLSQGVQTQGDFLEGFLEGGVEMSREIKMKELRDIKNEKRKDIEPEL